MKITIDTAHDNKEDIKKVVAMLKEWVDGPANVAPLDTLPKNSIFDMFSPQPAACQPAPLNFLFGPSPPTPVQPPQGLSQPGSQPSPLNFLSSPAQATPQPVADVPNIFDLFNDHALASTAQQPETQAQDIKIDFEITPYY